MNELDNIQTVERKFYHAPHNTPLYFDGNIIAPARDTEWDLPLENQKLMVAFDVNLWFRNALYSKIISKGAGSGRNTALIKDATPNKSYSNRSIKCAFAIVIEKDGQKIFGEVTIFRMFYSQFQVKYKI